MTLNKLLTAKDLGQFLALSKRQIFRLNNDRKLPRPVKIGGAIRWKMQDIIDWQGMDCPGRDQFEAKQKASPVPIGQVVQEVLDRLQVEGAV